jgi:hypothetical protein
MTKMQKTVAKLIKIGQTLGDWAIKNGTGYHDGQESWADAQTKVEWVSFSKNGVDIVLNVTMPNPKDSWEKESALDGVLVDGHTLVDRCSFTRRGVDTYSCRLTSSKKELYGHVYATLVSLLSGEYERCLAARQRRATSVQVPGLPFRVQPDWFAQSATKLRDGLTVTLTPAGFGTGYTLSTNGRSRGHRASAELETYLGVGPVLVETFDHD